MLAVNPTAEKITELLGYTPKQEPTYIGEREVDGKKVKNARISFVVATDEAACGYDVKTMMTFFIENRPEIGSKSGKIHVMDAYVRDAWGTQEQIDAKKIVYSNGPARIDSETLRKLKVGEAALTKFFQVFLNVATIDRWDDEQKTMVPNTKVSKEDCIMTLDCIADYMKGDFAELKDLIELQPDNAVKVMFGVRYDNDGNMHQEIYTDLVAYGSSRSLKPFEKELEARSEFLTNRVFEACPLKVYEVEASAPAEVANSEEEGDPIPPQTEEADW